MRRDLGRSLNHAASAASMSQGVDSNQSNAPRPVELAARQGIAIAVVESADFRAAVAMFVHLDRGARKRDGWKLFNRITDRIGGTQEAAIPHS